MIGISNHSEVFLWYKLKLQCAKDAHNGAGAEKAGFAGCSLSKKSAKRQTFSCKDDKIGRKG